MNIDCLYERGKEVYNIVWLSSLVSMPTYTPNSVLVVTNLTMLYTQVVATIEIWGGRIRLYWDGHG